jgi:hypothetical protein
MIQKCENKLHKLEEIQCFGHLDELKLNLAIVFSVSHDPLWVQKLHLESLWSKFQSGPKMVHFR